MPDSGRCYLFWKHQDQMSCVKRKLKVFDDGKHNVLNLKID